jgi:hypothetical protein
VVHPRDPQLRVESQAAGVTVAVPSDRKDNDRLLLDGLVTPQHAGQRTDAAFCVCYGKKRTVLPNLAFVVEVTPRPLPPRQWKIKAKLSRNDRVPVDVSISVGRVDENGQQLLNELADPAGELPDVFVQVEEDRTLAVALPSAILPAKLQQNVVKLNLREIPLHHFRSAFLTHS